MSPHTNNWSTNWLTEHRFYAEIVTNVTKRNLNRKDT